MATARTLQTRAAMSEAVRFLGARPLRDASRLRRLAAARVDAFEVHDDAFRLVNARSGILTAPRFIFTEPPRHEAGEPRVGLRHVTTARTLAPPRIRFSRRSGRDRKPPNRITRPSRRRLDQPAELPGACLRDHDLSKPVGRLCMPRSRVNAPELDAGDRSTDDRRAFAHRDAGNVTAQIRLWWSVLTEASPGTLGQVRCKFTAVVKHQAAVARAESLIVMCNGGSDRIFGFARSRIRESYVRHEHQTHTRHDGACVGPPGFPIEVFQHDADDEAISGGSLGGSVAP